MSSVPLIYGNNKQASKLFAKLMTIFALYLVMVRQFPWCLILSSDPNEPKSNSFVKIKNKFEKFLCTLL